MIFQIEPEEDSSDEETISIVPCNPDELVVGDIVLASLKKKADLCAIEAIKEGRFLIGNDTGSIRAWVGRNNIHGIVTIANE